MDFDTFKESLIKVESLMLPGQVSQLKMSPPYREKLIALQKDKIKDARKASVMALFYPNKNSKASIILILRKTYKGVHSAQVGFPGGKVEEHDKTLLDTALRETQEEIGVKTSHINTIKELTRLYIPPSNFYVHPFLGFCNVVPKFVKQESEVEAILEIPVVDFLNKKNIVTKTLSSKYDKKIIVPAYKLNGHLVWGATAMMLSEVKDLIKEVL